MSAPSSLSPAARYDVLIVGARPAGASLAARLGARGLRVLVVDKAAFPSAPSVPSCPVLFPSGMQLLDELGVAEASYADGAPKLRGMQVDFAGRFTANFPMIDCFGRDYFYGIDREAFDQALLRHLAQYATVTVRTEVSFVDVVRDVAGGVVGAVLASGEGAQEQVLADWVIGADGRFSPVARRVEAAVTDDFADRTSTVHFADWEGVVPGMTAQGGAVQNVYVTGRGTDILHVPLSRGRVTICTHTRSDRVDAAGDAERYYQSVLDAHAPVRARLASARRVSPVVGMKRVQNRYRTPAGRGWALVGDALHHKDPVDGQGIYDALLESKILAESILSAHDGLRTREQALAEYSARVVAATRPMFLATMARLRRELYQDTPAVVLATATRWLTTDPTAQRRFLEYVCRVIPPGEFMSPRTMLGAMGRGFWRDVRAVLTPAKRLGVGSGAE
ncbi:MAG TPA: NAD(P)/FAD-dependent oxidoreductase [Polyangiaceae bacterium]